MNLLYVFQKHLHFIPTWKYLMKTRMTSEITLFILSMCLNMFHFCNCNAHCCLTGQLLLCQLKWGVSLNVYICIALDDYDFLLSNQKYVCVLTCHSKWLLLYYEFHLKLTAMLPCSYWAMTKYWVFFMQCNSKGQWRLYCNIFIHKN